MGIDAQRHDLIIMISVTIFMWKTIGRNNRPRGTVAQNEWCITQLSKSYGKSSYQRNWFPFEQFLNWKKKNPKNWRESVKSVNVRTRALNEQRSDPMIDKNIMSNSHTNHGKRPRNYQKHLASWNLERAQQQHQHSGSLSLFTPFFAFLHQPSP